MNRVLGSLRADAPVATGTALKTVLQLIAAANHRAVITAWGISFNGATANDARILVELIYQTDAGTMTAQAAKKRNPGDNETIQTSGQINATAEPTLDYVLRHYYVDPEWGYTEFLDDLDEIVVIGGGRFGIRVTAGTSVSCTPWFDFNE